MLTLLPPLCCSFTNKQFQTYLRILGLLLLDERPLCRFRGQQLREHGIELRQVTVAAVGRLERVPLLLAHGGSQATLGKVKNIINYQV